MCFSEPGRVLTCYSVVINQDLEPNVKKKKPAKRNETMSQNGQSEPTWETLPNGITAHHDLIL